MNGYLSLHELSSQPQFNQQNILPLFQQNLPFHSAYIRHGPFIEPCITVSPQWGRPASTWPATYKSNMARDKSKTIFSKDEPKRWDGTDVTSQKEIKQRQEIRILRMCRRRAKTRFRGCRVRMMARRVWFYCWLSFDGLKRKGGEMLFIYFFRLLVAWASRFDFGFRVERWLGWWVERSGLYGNGVWKLRCWNGGNIYCLGVWFGAGLIAWCIVDWSASIRRRSSVVLICCLVALLVECRDGAGSCVGRLNAV